IGESREQLTSAVREAMPSKFLALAPVARRRIDPRQPHGWPHRVLAVFAGVDRLQTMSATPAALAETVTMRKRRALPIGACGRAAVVQSAIGPPCTVHRPEVS